MVTDYFAHTLDGALPAEWQGLSDHLSGVAARAAANAAVFDAEDWGRLAGLWHDLGKYSEAFQDYLHAASAPDPHGLEQQGRIDHSTAGAKHAASTFPSVLGHILAFVIAGHHSGLLDALGEGASLQARLGKSVDPWDAAPLFVLDQGPPDVPAILGDAFRQRDGFSVQFFVRMLFS